MTGDEVEDAVVIIQIDGPGNSRPCGVLVYTMDGASPKLLWSHQSGSGGSYGLRDAYARDGQVVVEEYNPRSFVENGKTFYLGGADTYKRVYYEWNGRTFRPSVSEDGLPNEPDHPRFRPGPWHNKVGEPSPDEQFPGYL